MNEDEIFYKALELLSNGISIQMWELERLGSEEDLEKVANTFNKLIITIADLWENKNE